MSQLRRSVRNLSLLTGGQLAVRVSGLFVTVMLTRYLGDEGFGNYQFCIAFAGLFGVLTRLGIPQILTRDSVRSPEESGRLYSAAMWTTLVLGVATVLVVEAVSRLMGFEGERLVGIRLVAIVTVGTAYETLSHAVFEAKERMGLVSVSLIVRQILWVALAFLGYYSNWHYTGFLAALALSAWVASLFATGVAIRVSTAQAMIPPLSAIIDLVRTALPLAGAAILVDIYMKVDTVMLDRMTNPAVVGHYSAGMRLVRALVFLSSSVFVVLFPVFSRLFTESLDRLSAAYSRAIKTVAIPLVGACAVIAGQGHEVALVLFGSQFVESAAPMAIAIWTVALQGASVISGRVLVAMDLQRRVLQISAASVVTNIFLNLVLIPQFGAAGAAGASVATMLLSTWLGHRQIRSVLGVPSLVGMVGRTYLVGILVASAGWFWSPGSLLVGIPVLTAMWIALMIVFRCVGVEEWDILRRAVSTRR